MPHFTRADTGARPFEDLLDGVPSLLREFLHAALQVRGLQELYLQARNRGCSCLSQSVLDVLNVSIHVAPEDLDRIAASGSLVVVANHPFGMLDGLVLDALVSRARPDLKIVTNALLCGIEGLQDRFIPLDVLGGRSAIRGNARSIRAAIEWLRSGHALAIFPAGEVSHWQSGQRRVLDPPWNALAVRSASLTNSTVLPVYFGGENSLAFQVAGILHPRLRTMRLPGELLNKSGRTVEVRVGSAITARELSEHGSEERATSYLRARTYVLGHRSAVPSSAARIRLFPFGNAAQAPAVARETAGVRDEIAGLHANGSCVLEAPSYAVYAARGNTIPALLREIGRLREITFRAVGEGTGRALDIDQFDSYYTHLILWHKEDAKIAGSYRFACTQDVLPDRGARGLYTSTLFRFSPAFFSSMGPALELGRSFVTLEYQKDHAPLLLLWQGIARSVAARPWAPVLFGAVSISAAYSSAAREMIVEFLRHRRLRRDLEAFVQARHPFRSRLTPESEVQLLAGAFENLEDLNGPIRDIDSQYGIPVLLRHYVKLGGRVAAFNVDRKFSNVVDALLLVDLRETPPKLLGRYMGQHAAADFLSASSMHRPA